MVGTKQKQFPVSGNIFPNGVMEIDNSFHMLSSLNTWSSMVQQKTNQKMISQGLEDKEKREDWLSRFLKICKDENSMS